MNSCRMTFFYLIAHRLKAFLKELQSGLATPNDAERHGNYLSVVGSMRIGDSPLEQLRHLFTLVKIILYRLFDLLT